MSTLGVPFLAWALVLSMAAVWVITYLLRYFVEPATKRRLPKLHGQFFVRKDHLTETGRTLWLLRNGLIVSVLLLWLVLWSLKVPGSN